MARADDAADGFARFEAGDLEGALAAFEHALASDHGLTRDELVRVLNQRALIAYALGQPALVEQSLTALATLVEDLEHASLQDPLPPPVAAVAARADAAVDGVVRFEVEVESSPDRTVVRVFLRGDAGLLSRNLEVAIRPHNGSGSMFVESQRQETTATFPGAIDDVDIVAVARGPGGAELTRLGTLEEPYVQHVSDAPSLTRPPTALLPPSTSDDTVLHVGLVLLASVVVVGVTTAIVIATLPEEGSHLGRPIIEF